MERRFVEIRTGIVRRKVRLRGKRYLNWQLSWYKKAREVELLKIEQVPKSPRRFCRKIVFSKGNKSHQLTAPTANRDLTGFSPPRKRP